MDWAELNFVLDAVSEKSKKDFELTRILMHSIYQVNTNKKLKPTDIMEFEWDNEQTEEIDTTNIMSLDKATKLINNITNGKEAL